MSTLPGEAEKVVAALNGLVETCKDSEQGFRAAAEHVADRGLKRLFADYAAQRAQFATELQAEVRRHGGRPEKAGSVAGTLHRGWLNLKAVLLGKRDAAIVAECERGEDAAMKNFDTASRAALPVDVQAVVSRQYAEIRKAHERVSELKHASAKEETSQRVDG
jgi:uncharacterized protein (TIGR02284 family)